MAVLSRTESVAVVPALGFAIVMRLHFPIFSDEAYLISWGARPAIAFDMYLNDTLPVFLCLIFFLATDALWRGARGMVWPVLLAVSISLALLTKFLFGIYYIAAVLALMSDRQGRRVLSSPFLGAPVFAA